MQGHRPSEQGQYRPLRHAGHAAGGADEVALDGGGNDLGLELRIEFIHGSHYT